jgi:hypothetical protein
MPESSASAGTSVEIPSNGISRSDWVCAGVLLAVTLAIFWQGWYDPAGMLHEDAAYLLQPYYQFAADEVRAGRFPHWNPFAMCGLPFHETLQGAVLYPLRWPVFWLSYQDGYALMLWVHYFLAALFTFIFMRATLRCRPVPALIGSISFAFGGFTLGHLTHPNYFLSYPWFVLTILLLSQAVERRRWSWAIAAGLPVGLMGLAGSVHLLLILGFGLGVWSLGELVAAIVGRVRSGSWSPKEALRPALVSAVAFSLGGALAAAQILPAQLQMGLSTRTETTYEFITDISAHPLRTLIRLVVPFYWGNYRLWYWGENLFHEQCFYAGIIPLIAAVTTVVVWPRNRWVMRMAALCIITFVVAAGRYLPVFWLLYRFVPMFDRLRDPARLLWWFQFGIACLAAIGLSKLTEPETTGVRKRAAVASVVTGAAVVVLLLGCLIRLAFLAKDPSPAFEFVKHLGNLSAAQRQLHMMGAEKMPVAVIQGDILTWLGILAAVLSCIAFSGWMLSRRAFTWPIGSVFAGLLVFDLGMLSAGMLNYNTADSIVRGTPPHARFLMENLGISRYLCLMGSLDEVSLHKGMIFRIRHAIGGGGGIFHTPRQEQMIGLLWGGNLRLASLCGVRYLVMSRPVRTRTIRPVFESPGHVINENTEALPRAFLARQVRVFGDPNEMLAEILGGKSDLSDIALFEKPVESLPPPNLGDSERGKVTDIQTEPCWFKMRTQAPGPRQLVLTETYHPEWRCTIDGKPVPIELTDWTFMSVRVPAGEHAVEWRFESTRFKIGVAVSLVTLVLIVGLLIVLRGKRDGSVFPLR